MSFLRRHLPVLLFAVAVLLVSGSAGSAGTTGSILEPFLLRLGLSAEHAALLHRALRKLGHFVAYAVFAWLALRSIRGRRATTRRHRLLAFGAAVILAIADETLQVRTASRGASALDVGLDALGAATMLGLLLPRLEHLRERPRG